MLGSILSIAANKVAHSVGEALGGRVMSEYDRFKAGRTKAQVTEYGHKVHMTFADELYNNKQVVFVYRDEDEDFVPEAFKQGDVKNTQHNGMTARFLTLGKQIYNTAPPDVTGRFYITYYDENNEPNQGFKQNTHIVKVAK